METMRLGRNDVCRCGSGKKYKKCCLPRADRTPSRPPGRDGENLVFVQTPYDMAAAKELSAIPPLPHPQLAPPGEISYGTPETIGSTAEHPFYVYGKGWTPLREINPGDWIRTEGGWTEVSAVEDTGRYETVYNVRVADHHTYFVGRDDTGSAVWAHNQCAPFFSGQIAGRPAGETDITPISRPVLRPGWGAVQNNNPIPTDLNQTDVVAARGRVLQVINYVRQRLRTSDMIAGRSQTFAFAEVLVGGQHKFLFSASTGSGNKGTPPDIRRLFADALRTIGVEPKVNDMMFVRVRERATGPNLDNHAERHILRELTAADSPVAGAKLLAVGSTNPVCSEGCYPAFQQAGLLYAIAVPTENGDIHE